MPDAHCGSSCQTRSSSVAVPLEAHVQAETDRRAAAFAFHAASSQMQLSTPSCCQSRHSLQMSTKLWSRCCKSSSVACLNILLPSDPAGCAVARRQADMHPAWHAWLHCQRLYTAAAQHAKAHTQPVSEQCAGSGTGLHLLPQADTYYLLLRSTCLTCPWTCCWTQCPMCACASRGCCPA
jgi:hypothetical protein